MLGFKIFQKFLPDQSQLLATTASKITKTFQSKQMLKRWNAEILRKWTQFCIFSGLMEELWMVVVKYMEILKIASTLLLWKRWWVFSIQWFSISSYFQNKPEAAISCKPGHLCPEIYKALDGILFIAETKKSQEEKMRVSLHVRKLPNTLSKLSFSISG